MPATSSEPATPRADSAVSSLELFAGEQVLWSGKPKGGIVFTGYDAWLVPFSILWFGFAIFMAINMPKYAHGSLKPYAVITPSLAIGFYMAIGRLVVDRLYRSRLDYVVTTQRIVIVSRVWRTAVRSVSRPIVKGLRLQEFRDGTGTIHLAPVPWAFFYNGYADWHACLGRGPMLFRIQDPRRVYDLIQRGHS